MRSASFILYVRDQAAARDFYLETFAQEPILDVPGMTMFALPGGTTLGLMPESGIQSLLGEALPDPAAAAGTPRAELYLVVDDPGTITARALAAGARLLSPLQARGWGDETAYVLDGDGHVLAFGRPLAERE